MVCGNQNVNYRLDLCNQAKRHLSFILLQREAKEYGIGCRTQNRLVDRLLKLLDIDSCYDIHRMKSNGDKVFFLFFFNAQKYIFGL